MAGFFSGVMSSVGRVVDWVMDVYGAFMKAVLDFRPFHTYVSDPDAVIAKFNRRYFHRSAAEVALMCQTSPLEVVGIAEVDRVARRLILYRAFIASLVTFLTMLPLSWIMWPLMVVDIVYYQFQVFIVTQELYILYKRKECYDNARFNYFTLATVTIRLDDTLVKHKLAKNVKRGVGWTGRWLAARGASAFRLSIRQVIRQVMKWMGLTVTKESVEITLTYLLSTVCAVIGGLISFWMFVPMCRRLRKSLALNDESDNFDHLDKQDNFDKQDNSKL